MSLVDKTGYWYAALWKRKMGVRFRFRCEVVTMYMYLSTCSRSLTLDSNQNSSCFNMFPAHGGVIGLDG